MTAFTHLRWAAPAIPALFFAFVVGCSGEPRVVEKIVEVEKVVVVTATPVTTPVPTSTPHSAPAAAHAQEPPSDLMICGRVNPDFESLVQLHGYTITDCDSINNRRAKVIIYTENPCGVNLNQDLLFYIKAGGSIVLPSSYVNNKTGETDCDPPLLFEAFTNIDHRHRFVDGYDLSNYPLDYLKDSGSPLGHLSPSRSLFADTYGSSNTSRKYRSFTVKNPANCSFWLRNDRGYPSLARKFSVNSRTNACAVVSGVLGEGKFLLIGGRETLGTLTGGKNEDNWIDQEFTLSAIEWLLAPVVGTDRVASDSSSSIVQEAVWTISSRIDSTEEQSTESLEKLESSLGQDVLTEALKKVPVRGSEGWQSFGTWAKDFAEETGHDPGSRFAEDPVLSGIHLLFRPEDLSYFIDLGE